MSSPVFVCLELEKQLAGQISERIKSALPSDFTKCSLRVRVEEAFFVIKKSSSYYPDYFPIPKLNFTLLTSKKYSLDEIVQDLLQEIKRREKQKVHLISLSGNAELVIPKEKLQEVGIEFFTLIEEEECTSSFSNSPRAYIVTKSTIETIEIKPKLLKLMKSLGSNV